MAKLDLSDFGFAFAHYGEERDINATDEEYMVYHILCDMFHDLGYDPNQIELVRKSNSYVSAVIGDYDVARIKYSDKAHWIIIPYAEPKSVKHYIDSTSDVQQLNDLLIKAIEDLSKFIEIKKEAQ